MQNGFAFVDASAGFSPTFTTTGVSAPFNCAGGTVEARRVALGNYRVRFNGMGSVLALGVADAGNAGGFDDFVSIDTVNDGGTAFDVFVVDNGGATEDVNFTILAL
jgi:hypothetical protein